MFGIGKYFRVLAKVIKRAATVEVLRTEEVLTNNGMTKLRLNVKRERGMGEIYVVLALLSQEYYQYCTVEAGEFDEFAEIVRSTQTGVRAERARSGRP